MSLQGQPADRHSSSLKPTVLKEPAAISNHLISVYSYCTSYDFSWWLCTHELCAIFKLGRNVGFVNSVFLLISHDILTLACVQLFCWMTLEDLNQVNGLKYYIEVPQEGRTLTKQKHCLLCTSSFLCRHLQLSEFFPAHTDFFLLYFTQEGTRYVIAAPA